MAAYTQHNTQISLPPRPLAAPRHFPPRIRMPKARVIPNAKPVADTSPLQKKGARKASNPDGFTTKEIKRLKPSINPISNWPINSPNGIDFVLTLTVHGRRMKRWRKVLKRLVNS